MVFGTSSLLSTESEQDSRHSPEPLHQYARITLIATPTMNTTATIQPRYIQYIENQERWSKSIQLLLDLLCPGAKIVQTIEGVPSLYQVTFDENNAMAILNTLMFLQFLQDCKTKGVNITEGRNLTKHWRGYIRKMLDSYTS